jgi:hypothetical protein
MALCSYRNVCEFLMIISLKSIARLVDVLERQYVFYEVGTEFLNDVFINLISKLRLRLHAAPRIQLTKIIHIVKCISY